jgi:hypothetical protein
MRANDFLIPMLTIGVIALSGCGKKSSDAPPPSPASATIVHGMASKGPIQSGAVKVFAISFGAADTRTPVGRGQTDANGNFTIDVGSYQGPVMVEVTSGSFTDEVSGQAVNITVPLRTVVPDVPAGQTTTAAVTPMTELAFRKAKGTGALTADSITNANASVASTFGLGDIVSTLPAANGGGDDQKKYAAACGAFSQLINDNKNAGELLDDALPRLLDKLGQEEEQNGKLSMDSIVQINGSIANFNSGAGSGSGTTLTAIPTPTSGQITLSTAGTQNIIAGVDVTVNLPDGVIVNADPITGEVMAGVVTGVGEAAAGSNYLTVAKYTPASIGVPARLHIVLVNSLGYHVGAFATIQFSVATGASFPATSSFSVASTFAKGLDGTGISGITCAPSSVEGI